MRCVPGRSASDYCSAQGVLKLLAIKDSDIRLLTLEQCRDAVDQGLHAGGAFSATIPLVALYYGGFLDLDVADPTRVARISSRSARATPWRPWLRSTRSSATSTAQFSAIHVPTASILNGHPGPILPGSSHRHRSHGTGLRRRARLRDRRPNDAALRFLLHDRRRRIAGRARSGKPSCSPARSTSTISACWSIGTTASSISPAMTSSPCRSLEPVFESFDWQANNVDATQYDGVFSRARAVPLRPAQRQAHRDHLPHHQRPRRAFGFL